MNTTSDRTKGPHQQLGLHPVLIVTSRPLQLSQRLQPRNCHDTALSHRSPPLPPTHLAWHYRSVIVSGAGPPVCLPATGSFKGIKNALHYHTPHLPPPHHQRLFHQGQPLEDNDPTPTTGHGPIHLTLRLVGLKGGGKRSRGDPDTDSTSDSDSDSDSHIRRKKYRKRSSKGELTQALRAMTSLADFVARICRSIQHQPQTGAPEVTPQQRTNTDGHGDQPRDQTQLPQGESEHPQARMRYCVNLATRHGDRQVLVHDTGYQPQLPPPPPTPVVEPLRFYGNPHSPEIPCAIPAPTWPQGHGPTTFPPASRTTRATDGGTAGTLPQ